MKVANWTEDQISLYWKQKSNEEEELLDRERIEKAKFNEGKEEGKKEGKEEGVIEGLVKGEKKGLVKGEIKQILALKKFDIVIDEIFKSLKYIPENDFKTILNYVNDNSVQDNDPEEIYNSLYGQNNTDVSLEHSEGSSHSEGMLSID